MNGEHQRILCNIAHCAFEVINRLLSRDQLLARGLRSSETGSRQIYREECITVEIATELRERFPDHVEITLFTPPEEARTGSDWYWRFEKDDRAIHARVQAKRVKRVEFGQSDRHGHIDLDQPQLIQLVEATRQAPQELAGLQAWLATYARFDATPPCGLTDLTCCRLHHHPGNCELYVPSLWIAKAEAFANAHVQRVPITQIVQNSVRLDCLLQCIGRQDRDGPEAKGFALQPSLRTFDECIAAIEYDAILRSEFEGALRIYE
jgi:hypothetical protein